MMNFKALANHGNKKEDADFEQVLQDFRDAYYNSGKANGGHCFRFICVRAPASSMAGFLTPQQKPLEALQEAKKDVEGLEVLDAIFVPKAAGYVGTSEAQMTVNRTEKK